MNVEDAEILYETKIDWTAVYSGNKIHCVEKGCDFSTQINSEDLTKHLVANHAYGEHPCNHPHCNFIAYSKVH